MRVQCIFLAICLLFGMKAFVACQESIVTPDSLPQTTVPAGEASQTPTTASPAPPSGEIVVGEAKISGQNIQIHVSNRTNDPKFLHLCTYDCTDTGDCRTSEQKLTQDKRKLIHGGEGKTFSAKLACVYQWDVLLGEDVCPETYRWGESYPNLQLLKADTGARDCSPPPTTTTTTSIKPCTKPSTSEIQGCYVSNGTNLLEGWAEATVVGEDTAWKLCIVAKKKPADGLKSVTLGNTLFCHEGEKDCGEAEFGCYDKPKTLRAHWRTTHRTYARYYSLRAELSLSGQVVDSKDLDRCP